MPTGLCLFVMSTADRWFIRYYHDNSDLGVFAVAAQMALIFTYAIETFRKAWWPIAVKTMYQEDGIKIFNSVTRLFCGFGMSLLVIFTSCASIFNKKNVEYKPVQYAKNDYRVLKKENRYTGTFMIRQKSNGFFIPDEKISVDMDIVISSLKGYVK